MLSHTPHRYKVAPTVYRFDDNMQMACMREGSISTCDDMEKNRKLGTCGNSKLLTVVC